MTIRSIEGKKNNNMESYKKDPIFDEAVELVSKQKSLQSGDIAERTCDRLYARQTDSGTDGINWDSRT